MGKKPVVTMIGLVWAGIALTGCGECCRNCRNKSCGTPAVASRNVTTPTMVGDARPAPGATNPLPPKIDTTGTGAGSTTSPIQPVSGTAPAPAAATQSSLASPAADTGAPASGHPLPSRMDDGLGAAPPSRASTITTTEARRVPPVPVLPKASDTESPTMKPTEPSAGQTLPTIGTTNSPAPPAAPPANEPLPPLTGSGSALPPLPN